MSENIARGFQELLSRGSRGGYPWAGNVDAIVARVRELAHGGAPVDRRSMLAAGGEMRDLVSHARGLGVDWPLVLRHVGTTAVEPAEATHSPEKIALVKQILSLMGPQPTHGAQIALSDSQMLRLLQARFSQADDEEAYAKLACGKHGRLYAQLQYELRDTESAWNHGAQGVVQLLFPGGHAQERHLDLASGVGTLATAFNRAQVTPPAITNVDINPHLVAYGKILHPTHDFINTGMTQFIHQVPGGHFDSASLLFGLSHLNPAERVIAFHNVRNALKPGGLFVLTEPEDFEFTPAFRDEAGRLGFDAVETRPIAAHGSKDYRISLVALRRRAGMPKPPFPAALNFPTMFDKLLAAKMEDLQKLLDALKERPLPRKPGGGGTTREPPAFAPGSYSFDREARAIRVRGVILRPETPGEGDAAVGSAKSISSTSSGLAEGELRELAIKRLTDRGEELDPAKRVARLRRQKTGRTNTVDFERARVRKMINSEMGNIREGRS